MASRIRITQDQMREKAALYCAEADNVNGVINKMDSTAKNTEHTDTSLVNQFMD